MNRWGELVEELYRGGNGPCVYGWGVCGRLSLAYGGVEGASASGKPMVPRSPLLEQRLVDYTARSCMLSCWSPSGERRK
jgi:hypothetical protein